MPRVNSKNKSIVQELTELTNALKESDTPESMIKESCDRLIVEAAVTAADDVLMEFSDGSVEHIDMLTADTAYRFAEKVLMAQRARRSRQLFVDEMGRSSE